MKVYTITTVGEFVLIDRNHGTFYYSDCDVENMNINLSTRDECNIVQEFVWKCQIPTKFSDLNKRKL